MEKGAVGASQKNIRMYNTEQKSWRMKWIDAMEATVIKQGTKELGGVKCNDSTISFHIAHESGEILRAKYTNIVLKRGMFYNDSGQVNRALWQWIQTIVAGATRPVARYDGVIEVMSEGDNVVANWVFDRGLPAKVSGPQLNAKTGEIAIEELHIAHEGLRLEETGL